MAQHFRRACLDAWLQHVDELFQTEEPVPDEEPEVEDGDAA